MGTQQKYSDKELLAMVKSGPQPASLWRHYANGHTYRVLSTAVMEDSKEVVVVYRGPGGVVFVRPLREWQEVVGSRYNEEQDCLEDCPRFSPLRRLEAMEARGFRSKGSLHRVPVG